MSSNKNKHLAIFCHGNQPRLGALEGILNKNKITFKVFQLAKGDKVPRGVDEFDGVILMGGPMGVYEKDEYAFLDVEMTWTEKMIRANKPVFGICLGCQMLAHMHDGEVFAGDKGFCVGFRELYLDHSDDTFGAELKGLNGFSWQGDTYTLGEGCGRLITGSFYHEQGVKFGDKVYGVQFHPEVTEEVIEAWYKRDVKNNCLPDCANSLEEMLADAKENLPPVHTWLEKFISRLF